MKESLVIGTRGSKLALWQASWVKSRLTELHAGLRVEIQIIKTSGDVLKNAPLSMIGGKGVFTKELEEALLDGRIDIAVHSLKDLPTTLPAELNIAAITEREDPRDALIMRHDARVPNPSLNNLPSGSVIGTSSLRRLAQLKHLRTDIGIKDLRGNVDTRLRKLDEGEYDAIILASAGLRRLGLEQRISAAITSAEMLPAVGQGALAIETRADDHSTIETLAPLNHRTTHAACTAERALLRALGGGCQLPIAGHAVVKSGQLKLDGLVAGLSGEHIIRNQLEGSATQARELGETLAQTLLSRGAASLLTNYQQ